jgi:hypothetical protein
MRSAVRILEEVESFGTPATGRLSFGEHGDVFVQAQSVCWAVARGAPRRLTDRLRRLKNPPLTRAQLEAVFQKCARESVPVGEALVSAGLVSEAALRYVLLQHVAESIVRLAEVGAVHTDFVAHAPAPYDSRFAFTTTEILAGVGAHLDSLSAATARALLSRRPFYERDAFAFLRPPGDGHPLVLAVSGCRQRRVSELVVAAEWAADHAQSSRRGRGRATIDIDDSRRIVAVRRGAIHYVALSGAQG